VLNYVFKLTFLSDAHVGGSEGRLFPAMFFRVSNNRIARLKDKTFFKIFSQLGFDRSRLRELCPNIFNLSDDDFLYYLKVDMTNSRIGEIEPLIRTPQGKYYIPATSIKGAIRTALNYFIFKNDGKLIGKLNDMVDEILSRELRRRNNKRKRNLSSMTCKGERVDDYINSVLRKANIYGKGQNKDILRVLRISDSETSEGEAKLSPILSIKHNGRIVKINNRPAISYFELIPRGTVFKFNVSIDDWLLKKLDNPWFPNNASDFVDMIFDALRTFSTDYKKEEEKYISELKSTGNFTFSNMGFFNHIKEHSNIKVGSGSTILATSLFMLLKDDLKRKIRDFILSRRRIPRNALVPETRKWIAKMSGRSWILVSTLGWAKLEVL